MIEILFGPDGVGKSRLVANRQAADNGGMVLHGTNLRSWFSTYPDVMAELGIHRGDVPSDSHVQAKFEVLSHALRIFAQADMPVVVDGHAVHKTAINIAAECFDMPDIPFGTSVETLVDNQMAGYFGALIANNTIRHTHVVLHPAMSPIDQAHELQRRIWNRGQPSPWDPSTAEASYRQVEASYQLEQVLFERGANVGRAMSQL